MVRLDLGDNHLSGRLPKVVAELAGLRVLRLDLNRLWGRIPPEWGDLSELRELALSQNLTLRHHSARTEATVAPASSSVAVRGP